MIVRDWQDVEAKGSGEAEGVSLRWVIAAEDGAPNFAMRVIEVQPGRATPHHQHAWEHEVFVLSGAGAVRGDEGERPLTHGTVVFVAGAELHQFVNTGAEVLRFLCLVPHRSPMTACKTLSEEKPFEWRMLPAGEIIVYPSDADGQVQRKEALVITPEIISSVRSKIQASGRIVVGASRDKPPLGSLGAYLRQKRLAPQLLSYLSAILVTRGSCDYEKEGKRIILKARPASAGGDKEPEQRTQ
ncbi:MAG: cupin domain-containing protein [Acidobacteriota bacterium]